MDGSAAARIQVTEGVERRGIRAGRQTRRDRIEISAENPQIMHFSMLTHTVRVCSSEVRNQLARRATLLRRLKLPAPDLRLRKPRGSRDTRHNPRRYAGQGLRYGHAHKRDG